jgi:hypothetical protein
VHALVRVYVQVYVDVKVHVNVFVKVNVAVHALAHVHDLLIVQRRRRRAMTAAAPNAASSMAAPLCVRPPTTLQPHDDFFASAGAAPDEALAAGAATRMPILSAFCLSTQRFFSEHVVVLGHVLSGPQRVVAMRRLSLFAAVAPPSPLITPIWTQSGRSRHTSFGRQFASASHTDGLHHENEPSLFIALPGGQSDGSFSARADPAKNKVDAATTATRAFFIEAQS